MNSPDDVLQWRRAEVFKRQRQAVHDAITDHRRHDDLPRLRGLMDASRNIDALTLEYAVVINNVIQIDADAYTQLRGVFLQACLLRPLPVDGPSHCIHDPRKWHQDGVTRHPRTPP